MNTHLLLIENNIGIEKITIDIINQYIKLCGQRYNIYNDMFYPKELNYIVRI